MSLKVGIIGLANVGKSTLFNALIGQKTAEVSDYPFCTIEPNKGIVEVPDEKQAQVAQTLGFNKIIRAPLEFIDIAGLIKGAHKGEGLGNEFLSHIQEVNLLCQVLPYYKKEEDPERHQEVVLSELILKDLHQINKEMESGDLNKEEEELLEKIRRNLNEKKSIKDIKLEKEERKLLEQFNFLTAKDIFYIANIVEEDLEKKDLDIPKGYLKISAKTEQDLTELNKKEAKEYLKAVSIDSQALNKVIKKAWQMLNLISFYTLKQENSQIQAWPVEESTPVKKAGGLIHTDFEDKFIQAQVINWQDLAKTGGLKQAANQGLIKARGEDYLVKDGDVINFKHGG